MESSAESMGEVIGVAIAAVVLTVTFGSLVAAGLPLISALIGIGIAICTITIATGFIELGSSTTVLAMMLGLAWRSTIRSSSSRATAPNYVTDMIRKLLRAAQRGRRVRP